METCLNLTFWCICLSYLEGTPRSKLSNAPALATIRITQTKRHMVFLITVENSSLKQLLHFHCLIIEVNENVIFGFLSFKKVPKTRIFVVQYYRRFTKSDEPFYTQSSSFSRHLFSKSIEIPILHTNFISKKVLRVFFFLKFSVMFYVFFEVRSPIHDMHYFWHIIGIVGAKKRPFWTKIIYFLHC